MIVSSALWCGVFVLAAAAAQPYLPYIKATGVLAGGAYCVGTIWLFERMLTGTPERMSTAFLFAGALLKLPLLVGLLYALSRLGPEYLVCFLGGMGSLIPASFHAVRRDLGAASR